MLKTTQPGGTFVTWKKVGTWKQGIGVEVPSGKVSWPGGTQVPPGDTGLPGKTTFKIGFITPTSPGLAGLSQLGKEFESAFKVAVEMMNKDLSLSIDFDVKIHDGGVNPKETCKRVAEKLVQEGVVAVIGAYRSECTMAAAEVLGKKDRVSHCCVHYGHKWKSVKSNYPDSVTVLFPLSYVLTSFLTLQVKLIGEFLLFLMLPPLPNCLTRRSTNISCALVPLIAIKQMLLPRSLEFMDGLR